jgi:hypothetical protein
MPLPKKKTMQFISEPGSDFNFLECIGYIDAYLLMDNECILALL